jgi:hypothetical protein
LIRRTSTAAPGTLLGAALVALAACGNPGSASPTPDPAATHTVREWPPPTASATTTETATATTTETATATAEPTATATTTEPAPSASASAAPVVKGFAFPSPKSGILSLADADKILKTGAHPKVRVLDAGKEPLAKLAYAPTKGATQALRVDLDQKVTTVVQGQTAPIMSPGQALDVDLETGDVDDATGALVTVTLRKMSLKPLDGIDAATLEELQKQLSGLNGYALRERVSPFGDTSEAKIQLPPTAPKGSEMFVTTMNDVFRAMLPNLPEEPVGVGAKWQSLTREDHGGANVMQLAEYTLKEKSGDKLTLGYSARQLAAGNQIKLPIAAPEGTTTQLTKFVSTTSGSLVVDTREIAPIKGRSTQETKVGIDVLRKADSTKLGTETSMKVTVSFARRGGAPAADASSAPSSAPSTTPSAAPSTAPSPPATAKEAPAPK